MDRKGGMAATAVLIAILGISFMPRKGGESASSAEPAGGAKNPRHTQEANPKLSEVKPACAEIADRVKRFIEGDIHYPASCYSTNPNDAEQSVAGENLGFAIALVPDPSQTNLPLLFDRLIETIQQAAQDEKYSYDSSWFPWTEERTYDRFDDEEKAEALQTELQQQPGVLAFRGGASNAQGTYRGGLLVFVVGEQPTGGINDEQFENAMAWIAKLGLDPKKLNILGPTFSGSLLSLERGLIRIKTGAFPEYADNIRVYSGTANSNDSIERFTAFLRKSDPQKCKFRTFQESDDLMTHRFLQFLQQSKFGLERVAILSEDQTAFGAWRNPSKGEAQEKGPIYLYYPRDIATLRAAYSQQSIFSAGKNQSAPSSTLRGDLGGAASSKHDSVHTYSGDLTPLAQEATLFGIVNVLKSKRIDFVVIRSSNSLDQLFLAEFLRRSYPGGRVVLDGADLLFRRGIEGAALRGLMMLSTYPLLSWTQDEIRPVQYQGDDLTVVGGPPPTSYRIFGSYLSEGAYIAARGLFKADKKNGDTADKEDGPNISDYGPPPFGGQNDNPDDVRPATWLTVVGHGQFWPIAVLNDDTLSKGGSFDSDNKAPDNASTASLLSPARPPANPDGKENDATSKQLGAPNQQNDEHAHHRSFPAETTALMLFCWALALAHCYLCWTGSMIGTPRMRAYFAPIPLAEQPVLIFIGSLLLGALGVTFAGATGLMNGFYSGFFLWAGVWCMAGLGLIGLLKNYSLPLSGAIDRQPQEREQAVSARRELARAAAAGSEPGGIEPEGTTLASQQEAWSAPPQSEPGSYTDDSALASESTKAETKALGRVDSLWSKLLYARDALAGRQVRWWKLAGLWMVLFAGLVGIRLYLNSRLTPATANAAFWRNSHITNGVSALLPQVLLILGMYAWFWYNLRGLSLFGEDRPVLPGEESLPELFLGADNQPVFESQNDRRYEKVKGDRPGQKLFSMFSADEAGMRIERAARPLSWSYCKPFVLILGATILFCALLLGQVFVLTLVDRAFGIFVFFVMCVAIAIILSDTLRFASAWSRLRQLLVFLDRLRLRRTLARLKGLSWTSVLSMSGNVLEERYRLMSRQLESVRNLQTALVAWHPDSPADAGHQKIAERELGECEKAALSFAEDYAAALSHASPEIVSKLKSHLAAFQKQMAKTAGCILTHIILPSWQREGQSLVLELESADKTDEKGESRPPLASDAHVQAAEEFFVLSYLGFIQNILGALRTVVVGILLLFTATTLALSSYPFSPAPMLGAIFLALFLIVGATVVFVYAEMHRDATLSHITQTRGELGFEFYTRIFSFGIGPLIGLLTTLFPSITDFVVSWLQPGAETIR